MTTLSIQHTKGHQDNEKEYKDLNPEAQINIQADKAANEFMKTCEEIKIGPLIKPTKLQVIVKGKHITWNLKSIIKFNYGSKQLEDYIIKENN